VLTQDAQGHEQGAVKLHQKLLAGGPRSGRRLVAVTSVLAQAINLPGIVGAFLTGLAIKKRGLIYRATLRATDRENWRL
jgi:hypothetical protein